MSTTRFAPSPTGALHPGNLRTALFSWLAARRDGGRFLLRSEDSDAARYDQDALESQLDDLAWAGLDHDGACTRQSQHAEAHADALRELQDAGHSYPCFCSTSELEAARKAQLAAGQPPRYAGTCRELDAAEREAKLAAGAAHAQRLRVDPTAEVGFDDLVRGPQRFRARDIGDFLLTREGGGATFLLANALDDDGAGVDLVLRGEDHLSNTPRQILILQALGRTPPRYGHLPLVQDELGQPLSKREQAASVAALRARGILPAALLNLLFRLGHHETSGELLDLEAMAQRFDADKLGRAAAHFDPEQLIHWQELALRALAEPDYLAWASELVAETDPELLLLVRPNVRERDELAAAVAAIREAVPEEAAREALRGAGCGFLEQARAVLPSEGGDLGDWLDTLRVSTGLKGKALFQPLRAALTGRLDGPELGRILAYLGADEVRERLRRAEEVCRRA